jgi:hypothetical protein
MLRKRIVEWPNVESIYFKPSGTGIFGVNIYVLDNPELLTLKEFYRQESEKQEGDCGDNYFFFNPQEPTKIVVNETEALRFEDVPGIISQDYVVIPRGNFIFEIAKTEIEVEGKTPEELDEIYTQMLSTFKFLNQ